MLKKAVTMIPKEILLEHGANIKTIEKGSFLFHKGEKAKYYYQIISGEVKMNNYNDNGREFIQGIFKDGESFGEPPLFIDRPYPANAEVVKEVTILILSKSQFLKLIKNTQISLDFLKTFAKRIYYKAVIAVEMSSEKAEHRILSLLDYFKLYSSKNTSKEQLCKFDFTRQEIANLTGLRVETVIRAIKILKSKGDIQIINKKIYR